MAKKKPPEEHENLERWLVSYGDFITLLFATFVVLYALSQVDLSEFSKLENSMRKAFSAPSLLEGSDSLFDSNGNNILDASSADSVVAPLMLEYISQKYEEQSFNEIRDSIKEMSDNGDLKGVDAKITDKGLLITFKDDFLFYSASATLTESAMKALDDIGVLIGEKFALHYIRVEGHTDNHPINTFMFPSNWELSGARASAIIRYFIDRFKFLPDIFTSVGYGETRPVASNDTPENRKKNRRVEILILKNKFKSLEHPTNSLFKMSKKEQEKFETQRANTIKRVKDGSKALSKLTPQESQAKNITVNDALSEFYAESTAPKDKSISIKNKTLYEESNKSQSTKKHDNHDDNWLNVKSDSILQKDINKQFDVTGD